ncbi:MAG: hypothetical protein CMJ18_10955 [Phycisphaeraceae bacterium]|nr:hypothetical protein [Phycisphaeraceae bacterium]
MNRFALSAGIVLGLATVGLPEPLDAEASDSLLPRAARSPAVWLDASQARANVRHRVSEWRSRATRLGGVAAVSERNHRPQQFDEHDLVRFDGKNDRMLLRGYDPDRGRRRTITLAVVPAANLTDRQILYSEGTDRTGWNVYLEDFTLHVGTWRGDRRAFASVSVSRTELIVIQVVRDGSKMAIYLNGVPVGWLDPGGRRKRSHQGAGPMIGGAAATTRFHDEAPLDIVPNRASFEGGFAHLVIHHRALSAPVVRDLAVAMARRRGVNLAPVAPDLVVETSEDVPVEFTVGGEDPEGAAVTRHIETGCGPWHGRLGPGIGRNLRYTPRNDFYGRDRLYYRVRDGQAWSGYASVTFAVTPGPDPLELIHEIGAQEVVEGQEERIPVHVRDADVAISPAIPLLFGRQLNLPRDRYSEFGIDSRIVSVSSVFFGPVAQDVIKWCRLPDAAIERRLDRFTARPGLDRPPGTIYLLDMEHPVHPRLLHQASEFDNTGGLRGVSITDLASGLQRRTAIWRRRLPQSELVIWGTAGPGVSSRFKRFRFSPVVRSQQMAARLGLFDDVDYVVTSLFRSRRIRMGSADLQRFVRAGVESAATLRRTDGQPLPIIAALNLGNFRADDDTLNDIIDALQPHSDRVALVHIWSNLEAEQVRARFANAWSRVQARGAKITVRSEADVRFDLASSQLIWTPGAPTREPVRFHVDAIDRDGDRRKVTNTFEVTVRPRHVILPRRGVVTTVGDFVVEARRGARRPVRLTWSQAAGPQARPMNFEDPSVLRTTCRASRPGRYVLRLAAVDRAGFSQHAEMDVLVLPRRTNLPSSLPRLDLWLTAGAGAERQTDGARKGCGTWWDHSPLETLATQEVEVYQPRLVEDAINGHPALEFTNRRAGGGMRVLGEKRPFDGRTVSLAVVAGRPPLRMSKRRVLWYEGGADGGLVLYLDKTGELHASAWRSQGKRVGWHVWARGGAAHRLLPDVFHTVGLVCQPGRPLRILRDGRAVGQSSEPSGEMGDISPPRIAGHGPARYHDGGSGVEHGRHPFLGMIVEVIATRGEATRETLERIEDYFGRYRQPAVPRSE